MIHKMGNFHLGRCLCIVIVIIGWYDGVNNKMLSMLKNYFPLEKCVVLQKS